MAGQQSYNCFPKVNLKDQVGGKKKSVSSRPRGSWQKSLSTAHGHLLPDGVPQWGEDQEQGAVEAWNHRATRSMLHIFQDQEGFFFFFFYACVPCVSDCLCVLMCMDEGACVNAYIWGQWLMPSVLFNTFPPYVLKQGLCWPQSSVFQLVWLASLLWGFCFCLLALRL